MPNTATQRILDACANRASEGLRVVEDYVRFVLEDAHLTRQLKQLRHDMATACSVLTLTDRAAVRETQQDVGTEISTTSEVERVDAWSVCVASLQRSKQSLRSLEEFGKVTAPDLAATCEALRYRLYTLEKAIVVAGESRDQLEGVSLCVLIDGQESVEKLEKLSAQLLNAHVGMIQLRDKKLADRELAQRAAMLVQKARAAGSTLIIVNDRADVAAAANADGVHLGQDDLRVKDARSILGPHKLIGVSTHQLEQVRQAVLDGANYLGAGPTFPSSTKSFDDFPGLDYLEQVAAETTLPTFAIGGIGVESLPAVLQTGVTRVAVSGAITATSDPGRAASDLLEILNSVTTGSGQMT